MEIVAPESTTRHGDVHAAKFGEGDPPLRDTHARALVRSADLRGSREVPCRVLELPPPSHVRAAAICSRYYLESEAADSNRHCVLGRHACCRYTSLARRLEVYPF